MYVVQRATCIHTFVGLCVAARGCSLAHRTVIHIHICGIRAATRARVCIYPITCMCIVNTPHKIYNTQKLRWFTLLYLAGWAGWLAMMFHACTASVHAFVGVIFAYVSAVAGCVACVFVFVRMCAVLLHPIICNQMCLRYNCDHLLIDHVCDISVGVLHRTAW